MDQAKDYWGRAEQDLLDRWPKGEDGGYETPAFLTDALEAGGEAELLCQMLRSYDIPVLRRYEKDGTLGKVVLGFSGYGVQLYVPASRLEEATAMGRRCSSSQASRASSPGFLGTGAERKTSSATRCRLSTMPSASQSGP